MGVKGSRIRQIQSETGTAIVIARAELGEIPGGTHIKGAMDEIYQAMTLIDDAVQEKHHSLTPGPGDEMGEREYEEQEEEEEEDPSMLECN